MADPQLESCRFAGESVNGSGGSGYGPHRDARFQSLGARRYWAEFGQNGPSHSVGKRLLTSDAPSLQSEGELIRGRATRPMMIPIRAIGSRASPQGRACVITASPLVAGVYGQPVCRGIIPDMAGCSRMVSATVDVKNCRSNPAHCR
jgi:hypothetical protein